MKINLFMNCLWYEDISLDELAEVLHLTSEELFHKIFREEEFTPEEIHQIVVILGLTKEEENMIFYS